MRAFVAIDLPPDAVSVLAHLQERLPVGRPTDPDTFHVTLAFLGENVAEEQVAELHDQLAALRLDAPPIAVTGLSTYGASSPAVLVADVAADPGLSEVQARVASAARRVGITLERRRFRPHVTLARFRGNVGGNALERLKRFLEAESRFRLEPFSAGSCVLYESILTHDGPVHEELARYPFRLTV